MLMSEGRALETPKDVGIVCKPCSAKVIEDWYKQRPLSRICVNVPIGDSWCSVQRKRLDTPCADSDAVMRMLNTCVKMGDGSWRPIGML